MAVYDIKDDLETLRQWQLNKVQSFEKDPVQFKTGTSSVTILDYFFRPPETASYYFPFTECAILETWKHCGLMKTVLVVCEPTKPVVDFANRFPKWIEIQSEPSLHSRPTPRTAKVRNREKARKGPDLLGRRRDWATRSGGTAVEKRTADLARNPGN